MVEDLSAVGLTSIATVIACLLLAACNAGVVSPSPAASSSAQVTAVPSVPATPEPAPAFVNKSAVTVASGNASDLAIADLNEDGKLDIVTTSHFSGVVILFGSGDGKFTAGPNIDVAASEFVRAVDLNSDTHVDLVATGDQIAVLLGKGDGTFAPPAYYPAGSDVSNPAIELIGLDVADLNADTIPDVVAMNYLTQQLSVLLGKGDGTFDAASLYACTACVEVAAADLDRDGDLDIMAASPGIGPGAIFQNGVVFAFLNDGAGNLGEPVQYDPLGHAATIALGDLNGDGAVDVITGNDSSNSLSVLLGKADGTLAAAQKYPTGNTHAVAVVDLNDDGMLDVLSGSPEDSKVWFYRGTGDGGLSETQGIDAMGATTRSLAAADFNGDGKLDLAVYSLGIQGRTMVSVFLQN